MQSQRAAGWDTPIYVVNLGGNDILGCGSSVSCAVEDILGLVDTIGPDHEIWWSKITMTEAERRRRVERRALTTVASQRPNVRLWDWPSIRVAGRHPDRR